MTLEETLVRLGAQKPELRKHIRPLLSQLRTAANDPKVEEALKYFRKITNIIDRADFVAEKIGGEIEQRLLDASFHASEWRMKVKQQRGDKWYKMRFISEDHLNEIGDALYDVMKMTKRSDAPEAQRLHGMVQKAYRLIMDRKADILLGKRASKLARVVDPTDLLLSRNRKLLRDIDTTIRRKDILTTDDGRKITVIWDPKKGWWNVSWTDERGKDYWQNPSTKKDLKELLNNLVNPYY